MVGEEIILSGDENDDRILLGVLYGLVEKCAYRLRKRALFPKKAGLMLRYGDQVEILRRIPLPPGSVRDLDLYKPLEQAFFKACHRRVRIRFMRVWFRDFSPFTSQLSLFPSPHLDTEKRERVIPALDCIRERHGEEAIRYARGDLGH